MENQYQRELSVYIDDITEPKLLYAMAIILHEGYATEFFVTLHDRLMTRAREHVVMRLAQLGTKEAYNYFIRLKEFMSMMAESRLSIASWSLTISSNTRRIRGFSRQSPPTNLFR